MSNIVGNYYKVLEVISSLDCKEDLLSDDFLKQFKTGEDLNDFLLQLQKRGLEPILNGEQDALLGYDKYEKSSVSNYRNGFTQTIRSVFPESQTQIGVVQQIRNACKYVVWKDRKEFSVDMKHICTGSYKRRC